MPVFVAAIVAFLGEHLRCSVALRYLCALVALCFLLLPLGDVLQEDFQNILDRFSESPGEEDGDLSLAAQQLSLYCEKSLEETLAGSLGKDHGLAAEEFSVAVAIETDTKENGEHILSISQITVVLKGYEAIAKREAIRESLQTFSCPVEFREEVLSS